MGDDGCDGCVLGVQEASQLAARVCGVCFLNERGNEKNERKLRVSSRTCFITICFHFFVLPHAFLVICIGLARSRARLPARAHLGLSCVSCVWGWGKDKDKTQKSKERAKRKANAKKSEEQRPTHAALPQKGAAWGCVREVQGDCNLVRRGWMGDHRRTRLCDQARGGGGSPVCVMDDQRRAGASVDRRARPPYRFDLSLLSLSLSSYFFPSCCLETAEGTEERRGGADLICLRASSSSSLHFPVPRPPSSSSSLPKGA